MYNKIWKQSPEDTRGYSYEDWANYQQLWEENENFKNYYGHDEKYLEFNYDFFLFGFHFYDDLMKEQNAHRNEQDAKKKEQDEKISLLEQENQQLFEEIKKLR